MHHLMNYLQLNWFQDVVDIIAAMNIIAQGARVMGWSKLADELGKIELAIQAMINASLNRTPKTGA
jgi:hypothetical protein